MYRSTPYKRPGGVVNTGQYRRPKASSMCIVSRVFDEHHLLATGHVCRHKHALFRWQGTHPRSATLVCDSLGKWLRSVKYTDVQSIPGLTLEKAVDRINDYTLHLAKYPIIILMVGTNNMEKCEPSEIVEKLAAVVEAVKIKNPKARLAYSAILFRPCDVPEQMEIIKRRPPRHLRRTQAAATSSTPSASANNLPNTIPTSTLTSRQQYDALPYMEKKRRRVNKAIRKFCDQNGIFFLKSWISFQKTDKSANLLMFADDGLHLEDVGIETLKGHIEGNVSTLIDTKKRFTGKKKRPKPTKSPSAI